MSDCIFCKIVRGNLPCYKVWEDQKYLTFLSIFPIKEGHVLVIPKKHTDYFFDLSDQELNDLMLASKKIAELIKNKLKPRTGKVGVMVAGMQVPHAHVHLIPMDNESELTFKNAKPASNEDLMSVLEKLKA